jgi:pyrimidine oxygenase
MLDEMAAMPGVRGVLLTFDDFLDGVAKFAERVQPLMTCRAHLRQAA